jgi:toxin-antitoxin system PIN domain toxin
VDLPDVNVLIHAFRADSSRHAICKAWLEGLAGGDARFGISPLALSAVARVVTNPRSFKTPSLITEVFAFADELLGQPNCEIVEPGERHWAIFKRLSVEADARGPMLSDVWYAALAIERGCRFITFDRDFARFPGLDWRAPEPG